MLNYIMTFVEWSVGQVEDFGLAIFLAIVCVAQYVLSVYLSAQQKRKEDKLREKIREVEQILYDERQRHRVTRAESNAVVKIFSEQDPRRTIRALLKTFVPDSARGFAVFFMYDEEQGLTIHDHRGISKKTTQEIILDRNWIEDVLRDGFREVSNSELYQSKFVTTISASDREKLRILHLVRAQEEDGTLGVLVSTQLFPADASLHYQQEVANRLLDRLGNTLRHQVTTTDREEELQLTQNKLVLQSIADRLHDQYDEMLKSITSRYLTLMSVDRAALFVFSNDPNNPNICLSREGMDLQVGVESTWKDHEITITDWAKTNCEFGSFGPDDLEALGVDSLIGRALVVPLMRAERMIGILCLTRGGVRDFLRNDFALADWTSKFLGECISRAADRVKITRKATVDGLTGLKNRQAFDEQIRIEVDRSVKSEMECSLCLLDLDHFKRINDQYGHQAGDEVLKQFARLLETESSKVRSTDYPFIARYGGEEMAVLLPGVGTQGAARIAESIRAAASSLIVLHANYRIPISVSIGVSTCPVHATSVQELIETADEALYQAKNSGRNQVCTASIQRRPEIPATPHLTKTVHRNRPVSN